MSDVVDVCTKDRLFSHLEMNIIYVELFYKILHMQVNTSEHESGVVRYISVCIQTCIMSRLTLLLSVLNLNYDPGCHHLAGTIVHTFIVSVIRNCWGYCFRNRVGSSFHVLKDLSLAVLNG